VYFSVDVIPELQSGQGREGKILGYSECQELNISHFYQLSNINFQKGCKTEYTIPDPFTCKGTILL
jgi:hypothetical protein